MKFDELNQDNWILFAIRNYDNVASVTYTDFECDIKKFKYIKRLFKRHETTGELKTHLILNHIILLYNVFGDAATPLLFFKIEEKYWSVLKSFLLFLDRLPPSLNNDIDEMCLKELNLI
jgi:hypothetical protein